MKKIIALCSCPRLGFMDFMGFSMFALAQNNVAYANLFGVYWAQALSEGIRDAVAQGYDYIITTDYDSLYSAQDVATLIRLMDDTPAADCIAAVQMGRFNGMLLSGEMGKQALLTDDLVAIDTAHFGLTIFRASAFADIPRPWFFKQPGPDGHWEPGKGKVDEDIYFWKNFKAAGKTLFLAPRVTIGHLELLVKWPDKTLDETYQTLAHYRQFGKPADAWA